MGGNKRQRDGSVDWWTVLAFVAVVAALVWAFR